MCTTVVALTDMTYLKDSDNVSVSPYYHYVKGGLILSKYTTYIV